MFSTCSSVLFQDVRVAVAEAYMERVGIVGWGLVGSAIGRRLVESGYSVFACDIDPSRKADIVEAAVESCETISEVAEQASQLIVALFSSDQVVKALTGTDGILAFPGHTVIDVTTADPADSEHLSQVLGQSGISYLDAPLSGSSHDIRNGWGVFLVGGSHEEYRNHEVLFSSIANAALYVGPSGSGSRAKLATNLVLGLNRAALAEGIVFARAMGIKTEDFISIVRQTAAYSHAVDSKGEKFIRDDYTPQSRVSQHRKDLDLITAYAMKAGFELPLGTLHRQLLMEAEQAGWGELDTAAVLKAIEARRFD